jgi:hypothetical protein
VIPENKCFCRKGKCLPAGLIDVHDCYYGKWKPVTLRISACLDFFFHRLVCTKVPSAAVSGYHVTGWRGLELSPTEKKAFAQWLGTHFPVKPEWIFASEKHWSICTGLHRVASQETDIFMHTFLSVFLFYCFILRCENIQTFPVA